MKTSLKLLILVVIIGLIGLYAWRTQTPGGYVFRPYESATPLRDGSALRDPAQIQKVETELAQFQASLGALTAPADQDKKLNTLAIISEYQQMLGKYVDAKKTLESALAIEENAKLLQSYSQLLFTMGAREGAVPYIDAAIRFAPETPELWRLKLDMLSEIHKDDLTKLDTYYIDAIDTSNNHIDIITMYASSLSRQGRTEEARKYWKLAQDVLPSRAALYQQEIDSLK